MKKETRKQFETKIFIRAWNATEGDIFLLSRIFNCSKRAISKKANYLRKEKKINLCKSKKRHKVPNSSKEEVRHYGEKGI